MAHTNSTTNYNLPQFISTDKPAWLSDINGAFADIDVNLKAAADAASLAGGAAAAAQGTANTAATEADYAKNWPIGSTFRFSGPIVGASNSGGSEITLSIVLPRQVTTGVKAQLTSATIASSGVRDGSGNTYTGTVTNISTPYGYILRLTVAPSSNVKGNAPISVGFNLLEISFIADTP